MTSFDLTKEELNEVIYCMEEMSSAYEHDEPDIDIWSSALDKLINYYQSIEK